MRLPRLLTPRTVVSAHCDLPCGVYDPAQARIEAESVKAICEKYQANTDPEFRTRALIIKEQRAELVKHHLWVLWTDYFKAPHFEKYPHLHQLFNEATKLAGAAGAKGSADPAKADELLAQDRRDREDLLGDQAGVSPPAVRDPAGTSRRTCRPSSRWCTNSPSTSGRPSSATSPTAQLHARALFGADAPALFGHVAARRRATSRSGSRCGSSTSPPGKACTASTWRISTYGRRPGAAAPAGPCSPTLAAHLRRARLPAAGLVGAALEPGARVLRRIGASAMDEWIPYRLEGDAAAVARVVARRTGRTFARCRLAQPDQVAARCSVAVAGPVAAG